MRPRPILTALVAVAALALLSTSIYAEPPGDTTLKAIHFVAGVDAIPKDLKAPTGPAQDIAKLLDAKTARIGKEGSTLYVVKSDLAGLKVEHASDCAINSQYQFTAPASLVKAEEYDELEGEHPIAKTKLFEQLLVAWTRSRHAAPGDIDYSYRPTSRADVTLNRELLLKHRTAMKADKSRTLVAQRR